MCSRAPRHGKHTRKHGNVKEKNLWVYRYGKHLADASPSCAHAVTTNIKGGLKLADNRGCTRSIRICSFTSLGQTYGLLVAVLKVVFSPVSQQGGGRS